MSLSVGLDVALSGLSTTAEQTAVVSRNVARANDPYATRKIANVVTIGRRRTRRLRSRAPPTPRCSRRCWRPRLGGRAQQAIVEALDRLDPDDQRSRARHVAGGDDPEAQRRAPAVCGRAAGPHRGRSRQWRRPADLADSLNAATTTVQDVRAQADAGIADSVQPPQHAAWRASKPSTPRSSRARASAPTSPTTSTSATRCSPASSEEVGIRTVTRANNDMAIFTDSGVTLFDVKAALRHLRSHAAVFAGRSGQCRVCRRRADHRRRWPDAGRFRPPDGLRRPSATASPSPIRASSTRSRAA